MSQVALMAAANDQPSFRCDSPDDDAELSPAIGHGIGMAMNMGLGTYPDLQRCLSTASSLSHGSATDATSRDSLGSDFSSRQSSASYHPRRSDASSLARQSNQSLDGRHRRRGYTRPQGTDFAASAKSRESVMNLGSIAHLQYYFARTGLLDGKGGQLARKKQNQRATLDLSALETDGSTAQVMGADTDSSYASMGGSPDLGAQAFADGAIMGSPITAMDDEFDESFGESESGMLPPTVSTYNHKEKPVPKPPTIEELKADLELTLQDARKAMREVRERKAGTYLEHPDAPKYANMPEENTQGWYELQGMHILDVVTLAIRAAKMYYTAHELPDRLDSIKSEKQVRGDLLAVMETLKQMATRGFKGGMKEDEITTMDGWVDSVQDILTKEQQIEDAEQAERASWTWLTGDWTGRELEREHAFLVSMDPDAEPLPEWTPASVVLESELPTPFLLSMQNGLRLIRLHNAVVKKSMRRFGAIPSFHTDTQKPYRSAENLRYWVKAAELRFEVMLGVDALGVVCSSGPKVWLDFEAAILKWCRRVRDEVAGELDA